MKTLLYTKIDTAELNITNDHVIQRAAKIGVNMVPFEGWSDADFGNAADRAAFPKNTKIAENDSIISDVLSACQTLGENAGYISIYAVK